MPRSSASTADLIQEHQAAGVTAALLGTAASVVARLANLPRRFGNSFFAMNDAEAGWRDWEVIVLARGLGRQYRDPRFSTVSAGEDRLQTSPGDPQEPSSAGWWERTARSGS